MKSLAPIQRLADGLFNQKWQRLHADGSLQTDKLSYPGVYLLAYTGKKLEGMGINPRDVLYVGMSNSAGGVRQRLDQFMTGIKKNTSHSGAMRFYREFSNSRQIGRAHV